MTELGFHFSAPQWLWALLAIPPVLLWRRLSAPRRRGGDEIRYADPHLLPFLTGETARREERPWGALLLWSLAWALLTLAQAGPRWDQQRIAAFSPDADLVILLDLSLSMNVADTPPSRLERAKQEIADLVGARHGIPVGLVAFASLPHVVAPITEDGESLQRRLPALDTSLVRLTGSRPALALRRGAELLAAQPEGDVRHLLLITDGDFPTGEDLDEEVAALAERGVRLHILGVGTTRGGRVPAGGRPLSTPDGRPVISHLEERRLKGLAAAGRGIYRTADFRDTDTGAIVKRILAEASVRADQERRATVWNERYHWFVLPASLLLLRLFHGRWRGNP